MTKFLDNLCAEQIGIFQGRVVHKLTKELVWLNGDIRVVIPVGFETDLASVPRLPLVFLLWGDRAHREAVLHDYLYRCNAVLMRGENRVSPVEKEDADWYFREAMIGQGNSWGVYHPMYLGVRCAGASSYHRMKVMDNFQIEQG